MVRMIRVNVAVSNVSAERFLDFRQPIPPIQINTNLNLTGMEKKPDGWKVFDVIVAATLAMRTPDTSRSPVPVIVTLLPAAVEEALRYYAPFQATFRRTTREVTLSGRPVPAGAPRARAGAPMRPGRCT